MLDGVLAGMHYLRHGGGAPPLVFVHGFACDHSDWRFQLEALRGRHEVVACDLRGHGATPGRPDECSIEQYGGDVAALLGTLGLPPSILVGHSMGCRVVLEAARLLSSSEGPERVAGLVLVDGSRLASGDPDAAESAARAAIGDDYGAFAEDLFRQMFFRPTSESAAIVERAVRRSAEIGPALWPRVARWDAARLDATLAALRAPLLGIQSTTRNAELRRVPMKSGDTSTWLELLKAHGARVEIVPAVGHFTQLEAPERVNQLIAEFAAARR